MTESTVQILLWMLAFTMVGFIFGSILGLMFSRSWYAEEKVEYLRDQLKHVGAPAMERRLRQMHGTLNDAHSASWLLRSTSILTKSGSLIELHLLKECCFKRPSGTGPVNPTKSTAKSPHSAVSKGVD